MCKCDSLDYIILYIILLDLPINMIPKLWKYLVGTYLKLKLTSRESACRSGVTINVTDLFSADLGFTCSP